MPQKKGRNTALVFDASKVHSGLPKHLHEPKAIQFTGSSVPCSAVSGTTLLEVSCRNTNTNSYQQISKENCKLQVMYGGGEKRDFWPPGAPPRGQKDDGADGRVPLENGLDHPFCRHRDRHRRPSVDFPRPKIAEGRRIALRAGR